MVLARAPSRRRGWLRKVVNRLGRLLMGRAE